MIHQTNLAMSLFHSCKPVAREAGSAEGSKAFLPASTMILRVCDSDVWEAERSAMVIALKYLCTRFVKGLLIVAGGQD